MLTIFFLLKTIIWTWIFFQRLKSALLKNETRCSQKRCKSTKNCLAVDIARDRSKTKNEKKSNNSFSTFSLLYRKIYILLENIFEET